MTFTLTYNDTVKADSPITGISLGDDGLFTLSKGDGDEEPIDGLDSNLRFIPKDDVEEDNPKEDDHYTRYAATDTRHPGHILLYMVQNDPDDRPACMYVNYRGITRWLK